MAYTNIGWPTNIPAGSDNLNTADDQLRRLRLDLKERFNDIVDDITTDPVIPKKLAISRIDGTPDTARAWSGAAFNIPDGVDTAIDLVQESFDTGGFHSNSVNPSRLTITTAAYYQIRALFSMTSGASAATGLLTIKKNGTIIAGFRAKHDGGTTSVTFTTATIDLAAAADYYEAWFSQSSGDAWATQNLVHEAFLEIMRLPGTV